MAWTSPRTWVSGEVVSAALLNAHLRDNLLETAPAKVTTAGDVVYANGANSLARLAANAGKLLHSSSTAPYWGMAQPGEWFSMGAALTQNTTQSVDHNTITAISWTDAEVFDHVPSGFTALHSTASNPTRVVMTQRGFWFASGIVDYASSTGGGVRSAVLRKNGVQFAANRLTQSDTGLPATIQAGGLTYAAATTDYIELAAFHTAGVAVGVGLSNNGTYLSVIYLGDYTT